MAWTVHEILLGMHIFLAVIWVGGIFFIGWGIYPVAKTMPTSQQQLFFRSLMRWTHWPLTLAGSGVIITGILLGTVAGPIRHWHDLWNTTYGHIWLAALLIGIATLVWGVFVGYRQAMNIFTDDSLWQQAESGDTAPLAKAMATIVAVESVEAIGFVALIICMLLLR
jgi:copper resistance protein D